MKKIVNIVTVIVFISFLTNCSSTKTLEKKSPSESIKEIIDPMEELTNIANEIIADGGIAAVGEATSQRIDIAKQKARTVAEGNLAEIFNRKIDRLKKSFVEEVGSGKDSEVNDLFSSTLKSFTSKTLVGAIQTNSKLLETPSGYHCGVVLAIPAKTVNLSIMQDISDGNKELYQRFRASKAFEELEQEIEKYKEQERE